MDKYRLRQILLIPTLVLCIGTVLVDKLIVPIPDKIAIAIVIVAALFLAAAAIIPKITNPDK